jgi:hypothetical protein
MRSNVFFALSRSQIGFDIPHNVCSVWKRCRPFRWNKLNQKSSDYLMVDRGGLK